VCFAQFSRQRDFPHPFRVSPCIPVRFVKGFRRLPKPPVSGSRRCGRFLFQESLGISRAAYLAQWAFAASVGPLAGFFLPGRVKTAEPPCFITVRLLFGIRFSALITLAIASQAVAPRRGLR
jgi:hypothetical protein